MIDLSFFKRTRQKENLREFGRPHTPSLYFDSTTITVAFLTPLDTVEALLPSSELEPLRVTPWHTLTILIAFEHRDSDVGHYNEVAITFPVAFGKGTPVLAGALRQLARTPTLYLRHLPGDNLHPGFRSPNIYGFPSFAADIEFERRHNWIFCHLISQHQPILTLCARKIPVHLAPYRRIHIISVRGKKLLHSEVISNPDLHGVSLSASHANLELGNHPVAEELRALKIGRVVQVEYVPAHQAILKPLPQDYPLAA